MTSPYNYAYPSPSIPSPLSSLLPSITQQTSGLGLTPNSNPFLAFQPNSSVSNSLLPPQSQGGGSTRSVGGSRREEINLDDCLRGLEEGGRLVERAKGVIGDIERIRGGVFSRLNGDMGGEEGRLELLQLEYDQIIKTIYELSLSTLFGSLPLTSISSNTNSNPQSNSNSHPGTSVNTSVNINADPIPTETTTQDLTTWLETRAALEFSRRESVKASSKVVLDVLKSRS